MNRIFFLIIFPVIIWSEQLLIVDPYYSPYMGANDLLFGITGISILEDRIIGDRSEMNDTIDIVGRALELPIWWSLDQVTSIVQHEIFGHGYRLRELGITPKGYTIRYDSGATYFKLSDSFLVGNLLAVDVAGLEAESILAQKAKMQWLRQGSIDGRLAPLYFQAEQSLFFYTLITHLGQLRGNTPSPGNDVSSYIYLLNKTYPSNSINIGKLTLWSAFNWLDPMTFYSLFSSFHFVTQGAPWPIPMIPLTENIRYLPNIKIGYAPYGPEAYIENFLTVDNHPWYFYIKGGSKSGGIGCKIDQIYKLGTVCFGLNIDTWIQRKYIGSATIKDLEEEKSVAVSKGKQAGIATSVTAQIPLYRDIQLFVEFGGKTAGYLPGYALSGALTLRGGISIGYF